MLELTQDEFDRRFMADALRAAEQALASEDVPVGAVVVHTVADQPARIIGRGCNQREKLQDPTAHAEMLALTAAAAYLHSWHLEHCTLYVTLEPCAMCAGALVLARLGRLVYAATDPKAGACGSLFELQQDPRLNHRVPTTTGVRAEEAAELLRTFFRRRRALGET